MKFLCPGGEKMYKAGDEFYISPNEYTTAEKNGIDKRTLEQRIREYGWDNDRAVTEAKRARKNRKYWTEIALENGISKQLFYQRIDTLKWDAEKASTTPILKPSGPKSKFAEGTLTKVQANGIQMQCFRRRIREGWNEEIAATLKPISKKEVIDLMHLARKSKGKVQAWYL